jgi:Metallo-peptidase family M12/Regulator of chromosome condensation (RCC1) repeat/Dockerin type I domain
MALSFVGFRRATLAALTLPTLIATLSASAQVLPVVEPFSAEFDADVFLVGGQAFSVDLESLRAIPAEGDALFAAFPISPKLSVDLLLHRINPRAPGARFVIVDKFGRELPTEVPETHFFGGSIVGVEGSSAFISVTPAGVFGWVQTEDSRFMITSGPFTNPHAPAVFDMASDAFQAIEMEPFLCEVLARPDATEQEAPPSSGNSSMLPNCRTVELALDTDQEFLAKFNGNASAAIGYIQTLVAGGDEIYRRDLALQLRIAYSRLWTTTDPWTQTSTGNQLPEFRNYWLTNMASVNRDVAHLLSGRSLGGGIAWLGAVCSDFGFAVDANLSGSFPTPLVNSNGGNWDITVFTHELGHNCGTPHTHDLCPPADQCAPNGNFGQCQNSQVCSSSGTIMSYCHLCNGGMSNILLNFHPGCITQINNYMGTASCSPVTVCSSNPACVLTISSASGNYPVAGGSATVTVSTIATGCAWTPLTVPSWITLTNPGPGSGNGSFSYTVQANNTPSARSFGIAVGDLVHLVSQTSFYDCNGNTINDATEIAANPSLDCDGDGILNSCEITQGAADCDANGVPDSCQVNTPVTAWGAGGAGTSGDPNYGQSVVPANLGAIKSIGAGPYHSLAVKTTGAVVAWGRNIFGQTTVPASVANVVAVAGGGNHSMALTASGSVSCWGQNDDGQCNVPLTLGIATAIAAGNTHSVALKSDGTVVCWGDNFLGQSTVPAGLTGVTGIASGLVHTMALRSTGTVAAWGENTYGQSTVPSTLTGVTAIGAGAAHSVARRSDGTVVCWGNNTFGQCNIPAGLNSVQKIFIGGYANVALRTDGSVVLWGRNDYGQIAAPASVAGATMFALGSMHTMMLRVQSQLADCDSDNIPDACEILAGAPDVNHNGIPDSCEPRPADVNRDGAVNGADLALVLGAWGTSTASTDINGDGTVNGGDLAILLGDWG